MRGENGAETTPGSERLRPDAFIGRRILIVEDETMVSLDISFALQDLGASVLETGTLAEAMNIVATTPLDAAILDIDLGGSDVFPAADVLYMRAIPIVFHTGHGNRAYLAAQYPDAALCLKPTMLEVLLETVQNAMES